jgi:hypothetical protein
MRDISKVARWKSFAQEHYVPSDELQQSQTWFFIGRRAEKEKNSQLQCLQTNGA